MNGTSHRQLGYLAGAVTALAAGQPLIVVALSGVFASASAHGWLSPDVDQTDMWVRVRQATKGWLPARRRMLLNHRYLSHWWGLPLAGYAAAMMLPAEVRWATLMVVVGWASHLVGDFIFGEGHAAGIPLLSWGRHVGLHLDTGGLWETGRTRAGRRVLPFAPVQVLMTVAIVGVFVWRFAA